MYLSRQRYDSFICALHSIPMNRRPAPIAFIVLLLLLAPCIVSAQEKISFDLKTRFAEKLDLAPAKNGALLILMESEWGSVTEFGEDYALWLRNVVRERRGDSMMVTLDVELRTGTLFDEGDLLKSRKITVVYHLGDDWKKHGTERVVRLIRAGEAGVEIATAIGEALHPVATRIAQRVVDGIELLMPGDYAEMKLEAMAVGSEVVAATREMVGEMEKRENAEGVDEERKDEEHSVTTASPGGE